jgi:DNA-binding CsgD family transcriptional regulator
MLEIEQIHRLIADIYDAALDPSQWNAALGKARDFVSGSDDETCRRLRQIVPHIRRAMAISGMIDAKTGEAAVFAETMDALSAGMIFVDAAGRIVHANASGRALLADGAAVRRARDRLVVAGAEADRSLKQIFAASRRNSMATGMKGVAVPLGRHDAPYTAHVLPLATRRRRAAGANRVPVVAVVVCKAAMEPSAPDAIARHFKLTPGELRVLLAVVRVGGVAGTAAALGIREATVKTHLHRVFGKTGTSRQVELVRLVAGFANPLLD